MSRRRLKLQEYPYAHSDFSFCSIDADLSISRPCPINLSHLDNSVLLVCYWRVSLPTTPLFATMPERCRHAMLRTVRHAI